MIIDIKTFLVFCIWLLNNEIHDELGIYVESEMHTCVSQMKRYNAFTSIDCSERKDSKTERGLRQETEFCTYSVTFSALKLGIYLQNMQK